MVNGSYFYKICRERRAPYQPCRVATKNPAVFLRKERFIRPDQHDHGRLRHTGNSILTLDPGVGRSLHFHCTVCIRCPDDPEIRHRNRMDEILSHDIQTGTDQLTNKGYDIEFNHVGFAYNDREAVL